MRALLSLDLSSNRLGELVLPEGWSKQYGQFKSPEGKYQENPPPGATAEGIIAIANAIPDMGDISSVNLLKNKIDVNQAEHLVSILKEHPTLKSLCGNKGDETELNMSGRMSGAGDAILLAAEIVDNGALTSINVKNSNIPDEKEEEIYQMVRMNKLNEHCTQ
jgi:hypothetical protein